MVSTGIGRVRRAGLVLVGAAVLMAHAGASVAAASTAQQLAPDEPLLVVESFLAARNARDPFGATGWTAAMLELQDMDGLWFVDEPSTRYWLRQLTDKYILDTLSRPVANGNTVTWTERLTPRSGSPAEPWSKVMTIQVHALVKDGKIANLSAPYPPLPIRPPPEVTAGEPTASGAFNNTATVAPATMFLGSALVLTLTVLLIARGVPAVRARAAFNRRLPHPLADGDRYPARICMSSAGSPTSLDGQPTSAAHTAGKGSPPAGVLRSCGAVSLRVGCSLLRRVQLGRH